MVETGRQFVYKDTKPQILAVPSLPIFSYLFSNDYERTNKSMTTPTKAPTWFWVLSIIALVWNLIGVLAYLGQVYMTPEAIAALPEAEQALYASTPAWATGAFAISVFAGALGCVFLLLRKSWAIPTLMVSLAAVLVQDINTFFLANTIEVYGRAVVVMPIIVITIGVALIWFARKSREEVWIV